MCVITHPIEVTRNGTFLAAGSVNGRAVVAEEQSEAHAHLARSEMMSEALHKVWRESDCRKKMVEEEARRNLAKGDHHNPYPLGSADGLVYTAQLQRLIFKQDMDELREVQCGI